MLPNDDIIGRLLEWDSEDWLLALAKSLTYIVTLGNPFLFSSTIKCNGLMELRPAYPTL